jgi:hypothetical protein
VSLALFSALVVSMSCNMVLIRSSSDVAELTCKNHFARVLADAIDSRNRGDWERAAMLYGYLLEYHPEEPGTCPVADASGAWLPVAAITLELRESRAGLSAQRTLEHDHEVFEARYAEAVEKSANVDRP